jgi:hypothetical protein
MTLRAMKTLTGVSWRALTVVLLSGAVGLRGQTPSGATSRARPLPEPPTLVWQAITPATELQGKVVDMADKGLKYTLFIPKGWTAPADGDVVLTAHFHGAHWFTIQEHTARGLKGPLLNFDLGLGSEAYKQPFEDEKRFAGMLRAVEKELRKRGGREVRVSAVDISSFSAGYAAVRELLQVPEYFELIRRIVLLDSLYGAYKTGARGRIVHEAASEHIQPWVPFAEAAVKGQKTFLITYSDVPTPSYANSADTATTLVRTVGVSIQPVAANSNPASSEPDYPLTRRADLGHFHAWGYAGKDQKAHLTHARHLGEFWQALDAVQ